MGRGLAALGLVAGDVVTEAQLRNLFGEGGRHPHAALALTEAATRIADRSGKAVPDEVWNEAADHFNEEQLSAIILMIGLTNFFNRINTTIEEPADITW